MQSRTGKLVVVSGPSGAGKSSICRRLREDPRVRWSVSATTRPQRPGEVDGRDYHFLARAEFEARLARGEFIEHAEVFGNLYGTLREPMEQALGQGCVYLLEIDVQGARQIRAQALAGSFVFIVPPSLEVLRQRLEGRGTETREALERRLAKAEEEFRQRENYDHVVVNDDLERATREVRRLIGLDPPAGEA